MISNGMQHGRTRSVQVKSDQGQKSVQCRSNIHSTLFFSNKKKTDHVEKSIEDRFSAARQSLSRTVSTINEPCSPS